MNVSSVNPLAFKGEPKKEKTSKIGTVCGLLGSTAYGIYYYKDYKKEVPKIKTSMSMAALISIGIFIIGNTIDKIIDYKKAVKQEQQELNKNQPTK